MCVLATVRVSGAIAQSTEVMKGMQQLVNVPQVMETMRDLSKEMMKVMYLFMFIKIP